MHKEKHSLLELAGILTPEEADELSRIIKDSRKRSDARARRIARLLNDNNRL